MKLFLLVICSVLVSNQFQLLATFNAERLLACWAIIWAIVWCTEFFACRGDIVLSSGLPKILRYVDESLTFFPFRNVAQPRVSITDSRLGLHVELTLIKLTWNMQSFSRTAGVNVMLSLIL